MYMCDGTTSVSLYDPANGNTSVLPLSFKYDRCICIFFRQLICTDLIDRHRQLVTVVRNILRVCF